MDETLNDNNLQDRPEQIGAPEPESPRPRRMPLTNTQIILIALIVVGGRLIVDFSQRIIEGQEKLAEQRQLEAEIEALQAQKRELEAAKAYYNSPAFIEAWAHSDGKMVRQGEVLIVPIYDTPVAGQTVTSATPAQSAGNLAPWQVWWTLFFDTTPPPPSTPQP